MPFEIVRNDIVNMQVDAIVNTANPKLIIGYGCDAGIHKKADPELLQARKRIGDIGIGQVAITPREKQNKANLWQTQILNLWFHNTLCVLCAS